MPNVYELMPTVSDLRGRISDLHGDCRERLATLDASSIDACVTDPPYGLEFMGKEWDAPWKADPFWNDQPHGEDNRRPTDEEGRSTGLSRWSIPRPRYTAGTAFQEWTTEWASEVLRVLKPGGHLLCFGGTRTSHRVTCAIEDAGFEVRDSIAAWMYASGFPKSLAIGKAIDKAGRYAGTSVDLTAPATDEAARWKGWGTALKPAWEPVIVARKPFPGTVVANVLAHGVGGLNIAACRVGTGEGVVTFDQRGIPDGRRDQYRTGTAVGRQSSASQGRYPANVVLAHHPDCADPGPCAEGCWVAELDRQSGVRPSGGRKPSLRMNTVLFGANGIPEGGGHLPAMTTWDGPPSTGTASRFFPTFRYQAKAPTSERPKVDGVAHPTVKPLDLMRWLVRLVTPPGGLVLDPFLGSGTTAEACELEGFRWVGCERDATYLPLIEQRLSRTVQPSLPLNLPA